MTGFTATLSSDVYKVFHASAGHPDIVATYENFTNRSGRLSNVKDNTHVVNVGWQYVIKKHLIERWNDTFFNVSKDSAITRYKVVTKSILGYEVDATHLEKLHDLGYLPLRVKTYPEGTLVPYGVACATFETTVFGFEWLVGMLETVISQEVWPIQTAATTSLAYQRKQKELFEATGAPLELLPFMIHDFSARGCFGEEASAMSGFGHLASGSLGSDTIAAGMFAEKWYNADWSKDFIMASVNATEHSVTCGWMDEGEYVYFKHLMENVAPTGILAVVSDTWDFWHTVTKIAADLKDVIMAREGKLVFRPDSGDPVDILCGTAGSWNNKNSENPTAEEKGLVQCLWDTFGGTITDKGFKMLDEHVGAIYGDAITLERQQQIGERLMAKGFVPQVVLGVGSYSFQHVTRDTHGSAMKATNVTKRGVENGGAYYDQAIFKDPKTDSKKKSAKGLLRVERENGELVQYDMQSRTQEAQGELQTVFENGVLLKDQSLEDIRKVVASQFK
jgi:nicotinamide phosphoribosyltransferase